MVSGASVSGASVSTGSVTAGVSPPHAANTERTVTRARNKAKSLNLVIMSECFLSLICNFIITHDRFTGNVKNKLVIEKIKPNDQV
jgi:hypothetical protein